jgi:glutaredoxin
MVKLTLYSKKDCRLCDIAKEKLQFLQNELSFTFEEFDIEKDSAVFEKYKYLIPVVEMEGRVIFTYRINENELKDLIRQKSLPG